MNICYVTPDVAIPYFRGGSTHVFEVSKNLSALGHRVSVVSRRLMRSQPRWERIDGFETYRTFQGLVMEPPTSSYSPSHVDRETLSSLQQLYGWYLGSYRAFQLGVEMAIMMSGKGIDIVIERETAFGAGAVLSSMLGVPMVLEMIGPRVSPLSLRRATKVLAYSRAMVRGRVGSERIQIVPAGVDTDVFRPDPAGGERIRESLGQKDEFLVGYVGTFQRWHGVEGLLTACKKLDSRIRKVKVILVGPYFRDTKEFAESIGMAEDALFPGPVPYESVPAYINACDVLCAPYDPQLSRVRSAGGIGAPLKVLEYMACGKPVIASRVPPITDVVEDGKNGLLVRPGDSDALAAALQTLIQDQARSKIMGREARDRAIEEYSWTSLARTISQVLELVKTTSFRARTN